MGYQFLYCHIAKYVAHNMYMIAGGMSGASWSDKTAETVLLDLSKAFDCITYDLT